MNMLDKHVKELLSPLPEGWDVFRWEALPGGGQETQVFSITGAVAPKYKVGPKKGKTNWKKMDKTTIKTVYIRPEEHRVWLENREKNTGNCYGCDGGGKAFAGWNRDTGIRKETCQRCGGSGRRDNE